MEEVEVCIKGHDFLMSEERRSEYESGEKIFARCKHCGLAIGFSKSFFPKFDSCAERLLARIMST